MIGDLIAAGASLASSFFGSKSADKANKAQETNAKRQYEQQKEFAKSGIQWKTQDALKAGIHPLYALGANTVSYSPTQVGTSVPDFSSISDAGQNIGRAIQASQDPIAKQDAYTRTAQALQLESQQLDNEIKRTQLQSSSNLVNQPGTPPGIPTVGQRYLIEGQGQTVQSEPPNIRPESRRGAAEKGAEYSEAGAQPDVMYSRNEWGGYNPVIPQTMAESFEQDWGSALEWQIRNKVAPLFSSKKGPNIPEPKGMQWVYIPIRGWSLIPTGEVPKFQRR